MPAMKGSVMKIIDSKSSIILMNNSYTNTRIPVQNIE